MSPLIGHAGAQSRFLEGWRTGRLHHAWLLAGPEGIGKRAFADAAARMVLAGTPGFAVPADHQAVRLIAAGSHPDLRILERAERKTGTGLAANITVEQVRDLQPLFQFTTGLGGWRVVILDAAEDMNSAAANALLKNLEEPPPQTLFLLVAHQPGRLLATIRSRCQRLSFRLLPHAEVRAVLERALPQATHAEITDLAQLADGAPGRALAYAGLGAGELNAALDRLVRATPAEARALGLELARSLTGKSAQPRYEAFLALAPRHLAARARTAEGIALARLLASWESAVELCAGAVPLSLDPAAVTLELARLVAGHPPS